ncbi:multidrug effflux MFS transporter [Pseudomonas coronafaciens]|uniref:Bcr/CflA family efflux transporter n=1 Tax=Pseudomonas coronafaciens pv. striafaciens TaxID=235276 RepID=A0A3M4YE09_9PSED|nr:multidrug effflux MFS transporter [Pseudomonas coronafaciens]RMR86283.1 Bcr/CflA family multidrug resistance transporter [Pseudomonas coronafaciens pv. striafaciens]
MNSQVQTPANEGQVSHPSASILRGKVILLLASLAAISNLSTNIILPAFPDIASQLNVTSQELGLTLSSFFITYALAQLVVGPLADRYGRKRVIVGGLLVFVAGTFWASTATTLDMLIMGRVIQGLGVCTAGVLSRAIARDLYEGETLARALSLTMIATATAPGFSPLVGSVLNTTLGWRALFILVGIAAILITLFYVRSVGETLPVSRRVTQSMQAIVKAYGKLLRNRQFIFPALASSLLMSGLFASFAATPAILMAGIGLTSLQMGLYFAATVFVVFAAGMAAPRLAHRFGAGAIALSGLSTAFVAGVLLLIGPTNPGLGWYTLSMVLFLWGMGLANPLATAMTMSPFSKEAGLASALLGFLTMGLGAATTWAVSTPEYPTVIVLGATQSAVCVLAILLFTTYIYLGRKGAV